MIANKEYFIEKWQEGLVSDDLLKRYKARQFVEAIKGAEAIAEFDVDIYFALVEKMTVYDGGRVVVGLLDGTAVECEI